LDLVGAVGFGATAFIFDRQERAVFVDLDDIADPAQAVGVLDLVLRELVTAYDLGWVHADMSEHNVAVAESGVTIFDWPQAVPVDHENAREFLERDVANLLRYFSRKYPHEVPRDADIEGIAAAIADGSFESVRAFAAE
jgi:RIO kinase 2